MFTFQIALDMEKDIKNRVEGSNKVSHGKNWKEGVAPEYQPIIHQLQGVSYEASKVCMIPFLKQLYLDKKQQIDDTLLYAKKLFDQKFQGACTALEKMTEQPLYRQDFSIFLTSFPRGPYQKEEGRLQICFFRPVSTYLGSFLHELQHFQVIHYYGDTLMKDLSDVEFEFLKEALTVILNDECLEFLGKIDCGYPLHQRLRRNILREWRQHHNFQKLLMYGCQQVKRYVKEK